MVFKKPYFSFLNKQKTVSLNDYCGIRQYPSLDYVEQLFCLFLTEIMDREVLCERRTFSYLGSFLGYTDFGKKISLPYQVR